MSGALSTLNRLALTILGILLTVGGAALAWWWLHIDRGAPDLGLPWSAQLDTSGVSSVLDQSWWPWVSGAVGVLLLVLGVRWALAHVRTNGVPELRVGPSDGGSVRVESGAVMAAAAHALERTTGARKASGKLVHEGGSLVARMRAEVDPQSDLGAIAEGAEQFSRDLALVLGRDDVTMSVTLGAPTRSKAPRVR